MSTVTEIIEAVKGLSTKEKEELLLRLSEIDFDGALGQKPSLQLTMNQISQQAKNRGLTVKVLELILRQD